MSYMRSPYPLDFFYGITDSYVFHDGDQIVDYGDPYVNNPSFIELIGRFVHRETGDDKYSLKIMNVLAKKLGCLHLMRDHKLTDEEHKREYDMMRTALDHSRKAFRALDHAGDGCTSTDYEFWLVWNVYTEGHLDSKSYMEIYNQKLTMNDIRQIVNEVS